MSMPLTPELFEPEIAGAVAAFNKYIICLEKPTEDCLASLQSLVGKAIKAYENRAPGLRHGIALDRQLTVILSQADGDRPLCAIYFNLSSPYHRQRPVEAAAKVEQ